MTVLPGAGPSAEAEEQADERTVPEDGEECPVGILGGTGAQGRGLAARFASAGLRVLLGSRDAHRARETAEEISEVSGLRGIEGADNEECARRAGIVLVAVPYVGHAELPERLREELAGKVVVDCVNPLGFGRRGPHPLTVPEDGAAEQARDLPPRSIVTAAFHHLSAVVLGDLTRSVDSDVLVLGDCPEAVASVSRLAELIPGVRAVSGGGTYNAAQVEAFTANLISVSRRYRTHAGLRVTGLSPT
ncbi:NADPH-dependent F420 reductase [Streptomyces sp. NPDC088747]|uniref:NADPH-dependent F420 reductase n=1 Tax=Streptomyces sp. NPDC088747 TaxID=3365886 RepID=UPI0038116A94